MSTRFVAHETPRLIGPGGVWDVTGWVRTGRGLTIALRRGMGIAGVRLAQVQAAHDGALDWNTFLLTRMQ